ncbi:hypothetical protein DE146DRAFT_788200 [Phaeosphaeria sp. MPI-PUGE-AT-0046c]|nr:hypothetical protein DE146DRAFT_788200 [Phaeosphaeria sp. MPI-PUGE-AT-0046c]
MPQLREIIPRPAITRNNLIMAAPSKQQPATSGVKLSQPQSMPSSKPIGRNVVQEDSFLEMLAGPTVTIQLGLSSFTLPVMLLARNSVFFRNKIMQLMYAPNKKRKRTPEGENGMEAAAKVKENEKEQTNPTDSAVEAEKAQEKLQDAKTAVDMEHEDAAKTFVRIKEEEQAQEGSTNTTEPFPNTHFIDCSDIDPLIFSLFLKFIYTGSFPATIDARPPPAPSTAPTPWPQVSSTPPIASPPPPPYAPPTPQPIPANISRAERTRLQTQHLLARWSNPTPTPAPAIGPGPAAPPVLRGQDTFIPPSVHAYMLAHRLASPAFMNYTLQHIYHAVGRDFALTPSLVDWVWKRTATGLRSTTSDGGVGESTTSVAATPPLASVNVPPAAGAVNTAMALLVFVPAYPLRKLLLDILIQHWPSQATHIIARDQGDAWDKVFDAHGELRREMMMGLQGGVKVVGVEGYYVRMKEMGVRA